jgi:hypothetical protein
VENNRKSQVGRLAKLLRDFFNSIGQTTTSPQAPLCPLPPAADTSLHWLSSESSERPNPGALLTAVVDPEQS